MQPKTLNLFARFPSLTRPPEQETRRTTPMLAALLALTSNSLLVDRGGYEIHVEAMGKGKPIVAIPGGPGFAGRALWSFGYEMQDVSRVLLFDQLGTGRSRMKNGSHPLKLTLQQTVADLDAVRVRLGYQKWTVFGQSWGAIVAVAYATAHPDRVDRLILASIPGFRDEDYPVLTTNLLQRAGTEKMADITVRSVKAKSPDEATRISVLEVTPYYFFDPEQGFKLASRAKPSLFSPRVFRGLYPEIDETRTFRHLRLHAKRFKGQTLLIQGQQDPCGAAAPFLVAQWLPRTTIKMIDGCGHFSFLEAPSVFFPEVREFLRLPAAAYYRYGVGPDLDAWEAKREVAGWPFGP
jgi:proline iminopeptidase